MPSPFLQVPATEWLASNDLAFAIPALDPAAPGHTLVVLRRVVASYFDATGEEKAALWALVDEVNALLDERLHPDGYDVSFSTGELAGPRVRHAHIAILPRCRELAGATPARRTQGAPRPSGAPHHDERRPPLATGGENDPLSRHLGPLFSTATDIAIVAAFVTETGLDVVRRWIFPALRAGVRLRIVTGDYLAFTQVDALRQLLGWTALELEEAGEPVAPVEPTPRGQLRVRVVETALADGSERAFHPKSWLFESRDAGVAFVGSSNLSRSALETGVEWNLRVERAIDPVGYASVRQAFEALWASAIDLDEDWIDAYAERVRQAPRSLPPGDADTEVLEPPPQPHEFQEAALAALARARQQGRRRALVVLATGLGKTWLAAFDVARIARTAGSWPRVLFLAHRAELLAQAARTFRRLLIAAQPADVGWCAGPVMNPSARVVVGSIQKLARPEHLARIEAERFDYVIVDEVHHADAPTYRRLLDRLDPAFLLGLTATPDRADEGDILGLFDDFVAYRADLGVGIRSGRLVPFAYHGVRDDIDYAQIPWRNRRFDPATLAAAVQTQRRMERLWSAWRDHPATRSLVFCCSIEHARFAATWLAERGVRVDAVYQGPDSGDRVESVARLERGELDALCVVDMFNEGVDIPAIDRVVMLRPTESPLVFLQQLGRGLRRSDGKDHLTIIDFVGNHQLFLGRIRRLLSLAPSPIPVRDYLESSTPPELPPGCSIDLELELKQLLLSLLPRGALEVERVYRELVHERGERPSIGELDRMGYRPSTLRRAHDGWFPFVASEGHLGDDERRTLDSLASWFDELETAAFRSPLPLVVLETLLEAEALTNGLSLDELAERGRAFLARSPELQRISEGLAAALAAPADEWRSFWRDQAVAPWTRGQGWFAIEGDRLVPRRLAAAAGVEEAALTRMTRELVDYRLHVYRARAAPDSTGNAFTCTVLWNKRDPILKLPRRSANPALPTGEADVRLPDGAVWRFRFAKEFINVAYPVGTNRNQLPDLMRRWFGPNAGHPGTRFEVHFSRSPDGWWIEPLGNLPALPARGSIVAYPSLRAAAGVATGERADPPEAELVTLPFDGGTDDLFAVRAAGDSMNGGKTPIADGDWLVLRWARGASAGSLQGRVALVQVPDSHETFAYQVKRIVRDGDRWWLRSDNPERASIEATDETVPIAQLLTRIAPETLAPAVGEWLPPESVSAAFGLAPGTVIERSARYEGHLFIVVDQPGAFVEPDRLAMRVHDRRPGETAFVLARREGEQRWRYCGVGRWLEDEQMWMLPPLDFATWRALGKGRDCSRRLPDAARERANRFLDELSRRAGAGAWIAHDGKRCRLVERTAGGVRIDGGEGGFAPRVVSSTDLAWVMLAAEDVASSGGVLDEARVNRLRYLEGTPKGSTRWIDTGWGIVIWGGRVEGR